MIFTRAIWITGHGGSTLKSVKPNQPFVASRPLQLKFQNRTAFLFKTCASIASQHKGERKFSWRHAKLSLR